MPVPPSKNAAAASELRPAVRVLCFIPIAYPFSPALDTIRATWGAHCDKLLFTSVKADPERDVVALDVEQGRDLWAIVHPGFTYIHLQLRGTYDWVLKADDDTFAVG